MRWAAFRPLTDFTINSRSLQLSFPIAGDTGARMMSWISSQESLGDVLEQL